MKDKYIFEMREYDMPDKMNGYLNSNPYPGYKLLSVSVHQYDFSYLSEKYYITWELEEASK
jgi:hypothetical protein